MPEPLDIAEGRRLLDEALPGPWNVELIVWARNNLPALLDALDEAHAGIERLVDDLAEATTEGFGIKSLEARDGAADLKLVANTEQAEHLMLAISDACGHMLDSNDATNYVEFEVSKRGRPTYVVHVRRHMRPTPHKLREQAEARAERAEAALARVGDIRCLTCGNPLQSGPGNCVSDRGRPHRYDVAHLHAALDGDQ
ncbi:hypothetical protein [Rhodococcus aetherivorans]|uniref:hypothetical protein n=1 Tax=Rhodococcus aetherivorans TaxID=191292 RepID=UPI0038911A04